MSQEPVPGRSSRAKGAGAWPQRVLVAAAVALALVAASPLARPAAARHSAAPSGSIAVNPASGPGGTTTQLSGTGFPRQADLQGNQDVFTFDGAAIPFPAIVPCDTGAGFGFGQACSVNSSVPFQIPTTAQPGPHTFHMQITETSSGAPSTVLVDASATFVVPALSTATPAATDTPAPTATATLAAVATPSPTAPTALTTTPPPATIAATATPSGATSTPPVATATNTTPTGLATVAATTLPTTNTPPPTAATTATATNTSPPTVATTPSVASTATTTPAPLTATTTPTAQPTAKSTTPFVAIVRPEFAHHVVAIALHTTPGAKIHVDVRITAVMGDGSVRQVFGATRDSLTNALGVFTVNIKIGAPTYRFGKAVLTIRAVSGGATQTVKRTYLYRVYG